MKTKSQKGLDKIIRKGKAGYFVPETMFDGDKCIIILNSDAGDKETVSDIIRAGKNIHVYSAAASTRSSRNRKLVLKTVRKSSSLFKTLSRSLNDVKQYRAAGTRPKSFDEFLNEL